MEELRCSLLGFSSASFPFSSSTHLRGGGGAGEQTSSVLLQLHPAERALITDALPLGTMCHTLRGVTRDIAVGRREGVYISALGAAIAEILEHYEKSVRAVTTASAVAALRPMYFSAFTLLTGAVAQQESPDVILSSIRSFVLNCEIPQEFRVCLGEAVWMGLLYTIAHYIAHGVVLHGRKDFFISVRSKGGREDHALHSDLLPHGVSMELGMLILSVGKERRVLLSETESQGRDHFEKLALGAQDEAANAVFKAIYDFSLCAGGVLALDELETRVEAARKLWSKALWLKVGGTAALQEHLAALRAVFLCHRGDLWHAFVEAAFPNLVDSAVSKTVLTESVIGRVVADAFVHALNVSGLGDVPVYEQFSMFVVLPLEIGDSKLRSIEDTARTILGYMRGLWVKYVLPQGLHLIVSTKAMEYYQRIFSFHIARRFSLHALHAVSRLFSGAFVSNRRPSAELRRTFVLMQLLLFLQTTLAYHLQVDVILLQTTRLEKAMENCKSVQDAKRCLDRCVWHVAEGSFITEGSGALLVACESLFRCSFTLYVLCTRYRLTSWAAEGSEIPLEVSAALAALETRVHQDVVAAFTGHLSGSATRATERALWARLDFNRFFSASLHSGTTTEFPQPTATKAKSIAVKRPTITGSTGTTDTPTNSRRASISSRVTLTRASSRHK